MVKNLNVIILQRNWTKKHFGKSVVVDTLRRLSLLLLDSVLPLLVEDGVLPLLEEDGVLPLLVESVYSAEDELVVGDGPILAAHSYVARVRPTIKRRKENQH